MTPTSRTMTIASNTVAVPIVSVSVDASTASGSPLSTLASEDSEEESVAQVPSSKRRKVGE